MVFPGPKINVTQTELQLSDLERQAQIDVEEAVQEYEVTRRRGRRAPRARRSTGASKYATTSSSSRTKGTAASFDYLDAQPDFNQTVKQFLDTAVRHRRSMLSLNTVVGRRIMP